MRNVLRIMVLGVPPVVFYKVRRLQEVQPLTNLWDRVGPLKETLDSGDSEGSMSGGSKRSRLFGARKLEVWMFGCWDDGMFGCLEVCRGQLQDARPAMGRRIILII